MIAAGGGIGGLCCAYEPTDRGPDVTVLVASGRTSGHVETADLVLGDRGILMGSGKPDVTAGEAVWHSRTASERLPWRIRILYEPAPSGDP